MRYWSALYVGLSLVAWLYLLDGQRAVQAELTVLRTARREASVRLWSEVRKIAADEVRRQQEGRAGSGSTSPSD